MKIMNPQLHPAPEIPRRSLWQKLGAGSLSISLFLHLVLLALGAIWVLTIIPAAPEKDIKFIGKAGGGVAASVAIREKQRVQMTRPSLSRVVALGATGLTLPEPDLVTSMTSIAAPGGSLSGGLGDTGFGGGRGDGNGPGFGSGMAPGLSDGAGSKNPFGIPSLEQGALVGTFYDLKQTSDRSPTGMTDVKVREELMEITRRGFKESAFSNYFKAPRQLHQTKLFIPKIPADSAPAAFEVEKEVQPRMWVVVYRGSVTAPKTGKFRFVGACDDFMVVRFNNRPVFDFGYTMAGTGTHVNGRAGEFDGTVKNAELAREVRRRTPMELPITFYKYASTPSYNQQIGGMAVGPEFEVEAEKTYPVEIMIGEIPGGFFSLALMIEEIGATYEKDPAGFPILPLFRLDGSPPSNELTGEAPPISNDGPIWKPATGALKREL